jgi:hypothetical protein
MRKLLALVSSFFIYLSLIAVSLVSGPTEPAGAQEPWPGSIQLVPPARLGQLGGRSAFG